MASSQQIMMKRPSAAIIAKPTAANLALLDSAQPSLPSASMGSDHSSQANQHLGQQDCRSSQPLQQQPLAVQQPPVPEPAAIKAEQGDANAQESVGNAEGVNKGVGRPQIGVSRAAQMAWANYKRSPKGQQHLKSLPWPGWLIRTRQWVRWSNPPKPPSQKLTMRREAGEQALKLQASLRRVEEIAELLAGLAKRPSKFSHLRKNEDYVEYWYEFADTKKKERKKESVMQATSASYLSLNVETMTDLAQDLGSEVVVADRQPPSKKHKANSKIGLPAPSPKRGWPCFCRQGQARDDLGQGWVGRGPFWSKPGLHSSNWRSLQRILRSPCWQNLGDVAEKGTTLRDNRVNRHIQEQEDGIKKCNMILEGEWEHTKLEKCLGVRRSRVRHPDAPRVGNRKSTLTKIGKEMPRNAEHIQEQEDGIKNTTWS